MDERPVIIGAGAIPSARATGRSALDLAIDAALGAVEDAGCELTDIDSLWACNPIAEPHLMFGTLLAERMKLRVRTCRTVQEAGAGPGVGLLEAAIAIHEGRSRIALVVEADNRGTARRRDPGRSPWWVDPVRPAARAIDAFADLLSSYSTSRGLTPEVRAAIPVSARRWGQHDPEAILREPITRDEILASPQVAGGLHRLECCLIGDWGGVRWCSLTPPWAPPV